MTPGFRGNIRCAGAAIAAVAAAFLAAAPASAQTYGLATMQPGTLANTVASAIAKTLKEKGGLNTLVQATAGESVLIPMVARGEIDLGMANMLEVVEGIETGKLQNDLRVIGSIYVLRMGFFARKDSGIVNMADVKGKRVPAGYSAMRTVDMLVQAQLALGGLTAKDVTPVLVPNVMRGADDFIAGAIDALYFGFGAPKVREADATVGGVRAVKVGDTPEGLAASRKIFPYGYFTEVQPIPAYVGVVEPMKVYSMDYILFTNSKMKNETVEKIIDTMAKNKPDMVATAPAMNDFSVDTMYRKHDMTYHPGALKYFQDHKIEAKAY